MNVNRYITKSLELNLFFGRIMKEHALFLTAGFTPADESFAEKSKHFLRQFDALLNEAITLSSCGISKEVLRSGELVTEFTELAEMQTQQFTGIPINKELTQRTLCLTPGERLSGNPAQLQCAVHKLNRTALILLDDLINFKETILQCVLKCEMFTMNYPLLIEHILREAKLYRKYVEILEKEGDLPDCIVRDNEHFWNQIMMEHAQFIRGLLDPCETKLLDAADDFARKYCALLEASRCAHCRTITDESLAQTVKFRDFKAAGTQGIQQCKIRSVILPLLADHVLREANHYIRLLQH